MPRIYPKCCIVRNGKRGPREYQYHADIPLEVGDFVKVPDRYSPEDGAWIRAEVMRVTVRPPPFETTGILGIIPGEAVAVPQGDLFGGVTKAPSIAEPPPYVHRSRRSTPYLGGGTGRNPNRLDGEFVDHRARLRDPESYRNDFDEDVQSMMDRDRE